MQELSELKQRNMMVTAVFNRLSSLWNNLEAAEEKLEGPKSTLKQYRSIKDREKATRFLLILNETYLGFHSQILAMDPMLSIGRIFPLAVQEESQRLATPDHTRSSKSVTLAASGDWRDAAARTQTLNQERQAKLGFAEEEPRLLKTDRMDSPDGIRRSDGSQVFNLSVGSNGG